MVQGGTNLKRLKHIKKNWKKVSSYVIEVGSGKVKILSVCFATSLQFYCFGQNNREDVGGGTE